MSTAIEPARVLPSLRARAILAAKWTMVGFITANSLRVLTNMVLTRLLFPEAFGLMAIVTSVLVGINLLSDLGVSESIVRSVRGDQPSYVNTAWTIQIIRGLLMAVVMVAIAGPVAAWYHQPALRPLLMVTGLNTIVSGFISTKTALADRKLMMGRLTMIDIGVQMTTITVAIGYALVNPSPWALLWANILSAAAKLWASHVLLEGPRNRLHWDTAEAKGILSFGLWITLSSTLTFFANQGNQLVLGKVMSIRLIGLVGLANALSMMAWGVGSLIATRVFYPVYAEILRTDPGRFNATVLRARKAQVIPFWCVALGLLVLGPRLIGLMYDPRYADAGLILQIQVLGLMVAILYGSYSGVLMSLGRVDLNVGITAAQVAFQLGGILLGSRLAGHFGALVGSSASAIGIYAFNAWIYRRLGVWHPRFDAMVLLASAAVVAVFTAVAPWRHALAW